MDPEGVLGSTNEFGLNRKSLRSHPGGWRVAQRYYFAKFDETSHEIEKIVVHRETHTLGRSTTNRVHAIFMQACFMVMNPIHV